MDNTGVNIELKSLEELPEDGSSPGQGGSGNGKKIIVFVLVAAVLAAVAVCAYLTAPGRKNVRIKGDSVETTVSQQSTSVTQAAEPEDTVPPGTRVSGKYFPASYTVATKSGLRLRETCSRQGNTLNVIAYGAELEIMTVVETDSQNPEEKCWGKTKFSGETGWVPMYYLSCEDKKPDNSIKSTDDFKALLAKCSGRYDEEDGSDCITLSENGDRIVAGTVDGTSGEEMIISSVECFGNGTAAAAVYPGESLTDDGDEETQEQLLLDVSELLNGRICLKRTGGTDSKWKEFYFADTGTDEAEPEQSGQE